MSKTLITDLYQLTMNAAYQQNNKINVCTFDLFVRRLPKDWGYFLTAGLEDVMDYLQNLRFSDEDVSYLRTLNMFTENYLQSLKNFRFTGDVWAMPEGTIAFPNEPIIRITAPKMEAQLIETYLLNKINFQTMIATKSSRVVYAAQGAPIIDFGLRRAHDESAGIKGARSAYIGGCIGTSNVEAGRLYNIPVKGTHAHSFVMSFDTELDAFRAYVKVFPKNPTLLIDTYDVFAGAKNAITVGKELEKDGNRLHSVRLDSGDIAEQSKLVRKMFDLNGLNYVKIIASNDLNEYKIVELISSGARIDAYGVGTEMITSRDSPAISGVYKLVEDFDINGNLCGKMKFSADKKTLPGKKQVYRTLVGDIIALTGEQITGKPLLVPIFQNGELVYHKPSLDKIREYAKQQLKELSLEYKAIQNPKQYPVQLSSGLQSLVETLTQKYGG